MSLRELFDFTSLSYRREDRILRFILRLAFVLFVVSLELIIVIAVAKLFIK